MTCASTTPRTTSEPVLNVAINGTKQWTVDGVLHREYGPAVEYIDGTKEWYRHGDRHREDGPAVEHTNGTKTWWLHGQRHREDGPAVECPDGTKYWYLNDQELTKSEWLRETLKDRPLTPHQRDLLAALSENWSGTPDALYTTATHLAG